MSHEGGNMCQIETVRLSINEHLTSVGEEILCVLEKQRGVDECCVKLVRVFVIDRLSLATEIIFNLFQREIETLETLLERRNKQLDLFSQPHIKLHRTDVSTEHEERSPSLVQEELEPPQHEDRSYIVVQEEPDPPQIKEEQAEEADVSTLALLHGKGTCSSLSDVASITVQHMLVGPHKRGRPRKYPILLPSPAVECVVKRKRGRPRKPWHPDFLHPLVCEEEVSSEQLERSPSLVQEEPEPPLSKGDQEELLQRPQEADGSTMMLLEMICEDDNENMETEPVASTSTEHMKAQADLEDCGQSQTTSVDQLHMTSKQTHSMLSHTGEKPYNCSDCGKSYSDGSGLTKHMKTHTGEKPFSCRLCDKAFVRKDHLKSHVRTHTGEKPFICTVCGKGFDRPGHLTRHIWIRHKTTHKEETEEEEERVGRGEEREEETGGEDEERIGRQYDGNPTWHPDVSCMTVQHTLVKPQKCGRGRPREYPVFLPSPAVQCDGPVPSPLAEEPEERAGRGEEREDGMGGEDEERIGRQYDSNPTWHPDFLHPPVSEEDVSSEQLERSPSLDHEDPEPPLSKGDQEELLQRPQEADGSTMTLLEMICEDDNENTETEPVASTSTEHMKTLEDCGQSQTTSDQLQSSDCSESHTVDSDEWEPTEESDPEDSDEWEPRQDRSVEKTLKSPRKTLNVEGQTLYLNNKLSQDLTSSKQTNSTRIHEGKKSFSCTECGKGFDRKSYFNTHMMIHTGEKPCICTVCGKGFRERRDLKRHMITHTGVKPHICKVCGKGFGRRHVLNQHMRSHTGEKAYICSDCGKGYSDGGGLRRHMRTHTGEKPFSCIVCGRAFNNRDHLKRHESIHKGDQHMRSHTGEKTYICSDCGKGYSDGGGLKRHMRTHTGEKPFSCIVCGRAFNNSDHLKRHASIHKGEKLFLCTICGKTFCRKDVLKIHMRIHVPKEKQVRTLREKLFTCTVCGKGFKFSLSLKKHMANHTGGKRFICTVCGKGFNVNYHLENHMTTHTGEKPCICTVCGKGFGHMHGLKAHMKTHTEEKPFICTLCGKGFTRKSDLLDRHMATHTGEKTNICIVCGKGFSNIYKLRLHMRTHTGEKPYVCAVCGKAFTQSGDMKRHMGRHTGGENI